MAYKCIHCSALYEDSAPEVTNGCSGENCRSKFFFYIKQEKLKEIEQKKIELELSKKEKEQMEKEVREIAGIKEKSKPVFLDFESIKVVRSGKYLLDLQKLFADNKPRIYKLEDGKYIIDLNLRVEKKA